MRRRRKPVAVNAGTTLLAPAHLGVTNTIQVRSCNCKVKWKLLLGVFRSGVLGNNASPQRGGFGGSGTDLVEKSVRFSLPKPKKKPTSTSVDNLIDDESGPPFQSKPHHSCSSHHAIHPDHAHHYCPGSTMSLNRRHLCRHHNNRSSSAWEDLGGGDDSEDESSPMMSWESTCLYENTG